MTIKGILFDKDGTLLDFHASWVPVNRAAAMAIARDDKEIADRILLACGQNEETGLVKSGSLLAAGNTAEIAAGFEAAHPDHGYDDLVELIEDLFQKGGHTAVPVEEMADTIKYLYDLGLPLGIATSDSHQGALISMKPFEVLQYFDYVVGYDSGHGIKPEPGMVEGFCLMTGLKPEEVMVVGDNSHDMEMGRAAGAGLVVGVLTGTSNREELSAIADHVVDNIKQLAPLLDIDQI